MLDSYLSGSVDRISPEAPCPIVDIIKKENKLGGAANVANNIKSLGGTPFLCSVIGNDSTGNTLISILKEKDISTQFIYQSNNRTTTNKTRVIGNNHQILRIDDETKTELNDDYNKLLSLINSAFNHTNFDCVLFQDYDKGVINKEIIDIVTNKSNYLNIPIMADPKKNNFSSYKNITLFKPNIKEFKEGLNLNNTNSLETLKEGSLILHDKGIEIVFITLSEDGIFISYKKDNNIINKIIPTKKINVVDVSGAGDSVISVVSMLINNIDIEEIAIISNLAGGIACEEVGVVSINKNKLINEYNNVKNN